MSQASRREFIRRAGAFSLLRMAGPLGLQLAGIGAAAAATHPDDYRALVCLFMYGANDCHNTVVPLDADEYARYASARTALALPRERLLPLLSEQAGRERPLGLHPGLGALQRLYQSGRAAILANVGPLVEPIRDATAFKSTNTARPPKLFSHNDQQAVWQALSPEGAKTGWGGRIADLLAGQNGKHLFTAISASGNAVFLASDRTIQYQIANGGAIGFNRSTAGKVFGSAKGADALRAQISATRDDLLQHEYAAVVRRSIEGHALVSAALETLPENDSRIALPAGLSQDKLAQQLRIVARMIGVRQNENIQQRRQVFFVSLNGFDTHDHQLDKQAELLQSVGDSMAYFQEAMDRLGVARNVTLFTASDFGRALASNGDGSDHGWGGHHFIAGGAVKSGVYGRFPDVALNTGTDVGNGRLLPTTSVDQYAATLARWMGVPERDLQLVLPNIGNFGSNDLGFLRNPA